MSDRPTPVSNPEQTSEQLLDEVFGLSDSAPLSWVDEVRSANEPVPLGMLGPYELLAEIGRGGQGSVYKAVQPGTGRIVAIKRMRTELLLHDRARERFRREVDAVTRLSHPGIVTVHSAEIIDGNSILVMEYVRGIAIDRWSDGVRQNSGERVPLPDILNVFAKVCDAVAHAHQRGVIHRDIKPSNILIDTDDCPHVLDFGIARLAEGWQDGSIEARTTMGFAGTPSYAPPEQINGSSPYANTLGDVYSLGVLLYRLLTGAEAFAASTLTELLDAIRSGSPSRPSQRKRPLPRELDWIVLKAIDVEPARRYQTLEAFADDVRRFLSGQPISAHPPGTLYRLGKFIKRHTVGVCVTAATLFVVMGLIVLGVVQSFHIASQNVLLGKSLKAEKSLRAEADANAKLAGEREESAKDESEAHQLTVAFMSEMIQTIGTLGEDTTHVPIPALYEWADQRLDSGALTNRPDVELAIRKLLAALSHNLLRFDDALEHRRAAADLAETLYGVHDERTLVLMQEMGQALFYVGRHVEAIAYYDRAIEAATKALGERSYRVSEMLHRQARSYESLKRFDEAEAICRRTLAFYLTDMPRYRHKVSDSLKRIAMNHAYRGELEQAKLCCAQGLEYLDQAGPDEDEGTIRGARADMQWLLSGIAYVEGDFERAADLAHQAHIIFKQRLRPTHTAINDTREYQARALRRLGRYEEAAALYRSILSEDERRRKPHLLDLAQRRFDLGVTLTALKRESEAREVFGLAVTRGNLDSLDPEELLQKVDRILAALAECGFAIDDSPCLYSALGDLRWLIDFYKYPGPAVYHPATQPASE